MRGVFGLAVISTLIGCLLGDVYLCENNFDVYKNGACIGVNAQMYTKEQVQLVCGSSTASLVEPEGEDIQEYILKQLGDSTLAFWIGVEKRSGNFEYTSGEPLTTYHPWSVDPADAAPGDDCVYTRKSVDTGMFEWTIASCTSGATVACVKPGVLNMAKCSWGWSIAPDELYCLKAVRGRRNHDSAEEYCTKRGGHLARRVQTYQQRFHAKKLAKKMYNYAFMTGVRGPANGGMYYVTGLSGPLPKPYPLRRRQKNAGDATCVALRKGKWLRKKCTDKIFFLCGKTPEFTPV